MTERPRIWYRKLERSGSELPVAFAMRPRNFWSTSEDAIFLRSSSEGQFWSEIQTTWLELAKGSSQIIEAIELLSRSTIVLK
jgi:hypothetical protein